jgi:hypothetical protein
MVDLVQEACDVVKRAEHELRLKDMGSLANDLYEVESLLRRVTSERDDLQAKIDEVVTVASETAHSWRDRCYEILGALGLDFGDPNFEMPDEMSKRQIVEKERDDAREHAVQARLREKTAEDARVSAVDKAAKLELGLQAYKDRVKAVLQPVVDCLEIRDDGRVNRWLDDNLSSDECKDLIALYNESK